MCGICGFVSKDKINTSILKNMNNQMIHRGPDDSGVNIFEVENGYTIGMAQRRLSILDLSEKGHQPMTSFDNRVTVVFNGEIYNFKEIRKQLKDYPFQSNCDTEVILAAYLTWGISCLKKLNGMFAIAICDKEDKCIHLIKDRVGKKPLYYWFDKERLVFASELKPIMIYPYFNKEINKDVLPEYLYHQYIHAPNTIFKNVKKLKQGTYVTFSYEKSTLEKHVYWDINKVYKKNETHLIKNYDEAKNGLKEEIEKSVKKRLISDVPLGTFLSGGYDSSLVTAIAKKYIKEPLKTYTIGFHEKNYNEAKYAEEISIYLGTKHTELYIEKNDIYKMIDDISFYYDEPFADSSQIPTMLVSKLASNEVKVVLSGDGGDEFFCGYNFYDLLPLAKKLDFLGNIIYMLCNNRNIKKIGIWDKLPYSVKIIALNRNPDCKVQFGGKNYIDIANQMVTNNKDNLCKYLEEERRIKVKDWQLKRMLLDINTYLPDDILCKIDRGAMKYSLETRCPLLDQDVMEYSFRIPKKFKYSRTNKKKILKDITYDYIPKKLLDRPKHGFSIPLDKWIRGELKEEILEFSNKEYLKKQGMFDISYTEDFIKKYMEKGDMGEKTGENYSRVIWSFYIFQKWYEKYF